MHGSVFLWWGAQDNLFATCDGCRNGQHQQGREQWRGSSGNIETHFFNAHGFAPASHPFHGFQFLSCLVLDGVEFPEIFCGEDDGFFECWIQTGYGLPDLLRRHCNCSDLHTVKFPRVFSYCCVATFLNGRHHFAHGFFQCCK